MTMRVVVVVMAVVVVGSRIVSVHILDMPRRSRQGAVDAGPCPSPD